MGTKPPFDGILFYRRSSGETALGELHRQSGTKEQGLPPRLWSLFAELDCLSGPLPIGVLEPALRELRVRAPELGAFRLFDGHGYRRNELRRTPCYQALLICWRAGQRSLIHDHQGSGCAYRVLQGSASETVFARSAAGLVYPTHTREQTRGFVCASEGDDIHQVSNLQESEDLVTLHLYSPPLLAMNTYSLTGSTTQALLAPPALLHTGAGI